MFSCCSIFPGAGTGQALFFTVLCAPSFRFTIGFFLDVAFGDVSFLGLYLSARRAFVHARDPLLKILFSHQLRLFGNSCHCVKVKPKRRKCVIKKSIISNIALSGISNFGTHPLECPHSKLAFGLDQDR
jgi:hypothetical protein